MGKSSWVYSYTQGLFPTCCRWYCVSWLLHELLLSSYGRGVRPRARPFYVISPMLFLLDLIMNGHVSEPCVWWFQNYVASATKFELGVVITLFVLRCILNYLRTLCNMWHVYWIMYGLGWYIGYDSRSFVILNRLSGLYGLKYDSVTTPVIAVALVLL
jgi:hypothetical protein